MKRIVTGTMLAFALAGCSVGADVPLAERGVEHFHAMLGRGEIDAIVASAAPDLNAPGPRAKFAGLLTAVSRKLGSLKSTKQVGWNDQATTGGHFISLNYHPQPSRAVRRRR